MRKKVLVVGGGISGISVSRMISSFSDPIVFEKESTPGGLIRCKRANDCLYHLLGGHVFNTKIDSVKEWFHQQFDMNDFEWKARNAKIQLNYKIIGYPIEHHLYQLDEELQALIISDLLGLLSLDQDKFQSFADFLLKRFGQTLCDRYFYPYNHKIWGNDLRQIPVSWLEGKLPMPSVNEILLSNIRREAESEMVHSSFLYAKENGSQFIIDHLSQNTDVRCNTLITKISRENNRLIINDCEAASAVVFTGDISCASDIIQTDDAVARKLMHDLRRLKARGIKNAFCECDAVDTSWLYIPNSKLEAHRIIYTGQFNASNNRGSSRMTCVVEFNYNTPDDVIEHEIQMLPGNLKLIQTNSVEKAYVVQEETTRAEIKHLRSILSKRGIFLLGRFAEWEYYNIDKCIEAAQRVASELRHYLQGQK